MEEDHVASHESVASLIEAGDPVTAVRLAIPMLEAAPEDLVVWQQVLDALVAMGAASDTLVFWPTLAEAWAESRNLPMAIAATIEFKRIGGNPELVLGGLAKRYAAGSPRLTQADLPPPPIPTSRGVPSIEEKNPSKLRKLAKEACFLAIGAAESLAARGDQLPAMPLWSRLSPEAFADLVSDMEMVKAKEGAVVIRQGDPGDSIFWLAKGSVVIRRKEASGEEKELARLGPGSFIGEMSIVSSAPRVASAVALKQTILLKVKRESLDKLIKRHPAMGDVLVAFCQTRMLENLIHSSPVLRVVPAKKRMDLLSMFQTRKAKKGELIIGQGKEVSGLFLVVNGQVTVYREDKGERCVISNLETGHIFGEISLLLQRTANASVRASEKTLLLYLPKEKFLEAVRAYPEMFASVYEIAVERERQTASILGQEAEDADDLVLI